MDSTLHNARKQRNIDTNVKYINNAIQTDRKHEKKLKNIDYKFFNPLTI